MKKTIIDLFEASVRKYGAKTFLLEKRHHKFEPTTYAETREQALEAGAGLAALGIRPGDKVAILAEGSNAWIISELGLFYAGAVSVPLSVKLEESNDLLFRMRHAEVKAVFVSKHQLPKIRRIRAGLPQLEQVIVLGHIPLESGETAYGTLKRLGREYLAKNKEKFMEIGQAIRNDDYATITYTSGTTSDPKGVILTQRNYTTNVEKAVSRVDIPRSRRWPRTSGKTSKGPYGPRGDSPRRFSTSRSARHTHTTATGTAGAADGASCWPPSSGFSTRCCSARCGRRSVATSSSSSGAVRCSTRSCSGFSTPSESRCSRDTAFRRRRP